MIYFKALLLLECNSNVVLISALQQGESAIYMIVPSLLDIPSIPNPFHPFGHHRGIPGGSEIKNPPANAGDARGAGSIPGSRRSHGGGNGRPLWYPCLDPLQYFCLENPRDRGAWWAAFYRVAQSQTWLKRLSSSSSSSSILAWKIVRAEEPDELQSIGLQRAECDEHAGHPRAPGWAPCAI